MLKFVQKVHFGYSGGLLKSVKTFQDSRFHIDQNHQMKILMLQIAFFNFSWVFEKKWLLQAVAKWCDPSIFKHKMASFAYIFMVFQAFYITLIVILIIKFLCIRQKNLISCCQIKKICFFRVLMISVKNCSFSKSSSWKNWAKKVKNQIYPLILNLNYN